MSESLRLITQPAALLREFESACAWAEEIRVCTSRIDSRRGACPAWKALIRSSARIVVVTHRRTRDKHALRELHRPGLLRLIGESETEGSFRPNIYLFFNNGQLRALVGSARLAYPDFDSTTNLMVSWHGPRHHHFAAELIHFVETCRSRAFLPGSGTKTEAEARSQDADLDREESSEVVDSGVAPDSPPAFDFLLTNQGLLFKPSEKTEDASETAPPSVLPVGTFSEIPSVSDVWSLLLFQGGLTTDDAVRRVAAGLREKGKVNFKKLNCKGYVYKTIKKIIDKGVKQSYIDRPFKGTVRAILTDPYQYSEDAWELCILRSLPSTPTPDEVALKLAVDWATATLGLQFKKLPSNGKILTSLREAIERLLALEDIERDREGNLLNMPEVEGP